MELRDKTIEELHERLSAIGTEMETEGVDLTALHDEAKAISDELSVRADKAEKEAELRNMIANNETEEPVKVLETNDSNEGEIRKMEKYSVDSIEYRDAWTKSIVNRELTVEERSALTSAGAVIPTMTVNAVWDKLVDPSDLLAKVDVTRFPSYVRFPKATTNNPASAGAVGAEISESSDVIGYVDLVPNEYVKLLTVGADIDHMAISAVHDWIVENLVSQIKAAINSDILVGSGTNQLKGITASVDANGTAIPATVTKASILKIMGSLKAQYQNGAIWIMSANMFYNNIMGLTQLNDYVINDGFSMKLFGHDVILMSDAVVSSKETIFYGDPKAYKLNIFKPLEVKPFETATTTNLQFRGACLADGELLDTSAFVRFAQS